MGAFLLAAGEHGRRSALPNARIMMHQPWSTGTKGSAADIEIAAKEIVYLRAKMFEIMGKLTRQPLERIEREFDRDHYMSAEEAVRYGMIDRVVERREELVPSLPPLASLASGQAAPLASGHATATEPLATVAV
jgi:ATP-dependent Clp protease protease subunit